jgi:hypothetical protein
MQAMSAQVAFATTLVEVNLGFRGKVRLSSFASSIGLTFRYLGSFDMYF